MTLDELPDGWDMTAFLDDLRQRDGSEQEEPLHVPTPCTHNELIVLDAPWGSFEDDHETAPVSCFDCKGLFIATIYKTEQAAEVRPMSNAEVVRYSPRPLTTAQAGSAWWAA